jgi:hypothetical protein
MAFFVRCGSDLFFVSWWSNLFAVNMSDARSTRALIIGTSPEAEVLRDSALALRLMKNFTIMCINTAYDFFPILDFLFFNGRFTQLSDESFHPRTIGLIFSPVDMPKIRNYKIFRFHTRQRDFESKISVDISKPLPHGPTTLLDIVFPACGFMEFKEIYILGAEYRRNVEYKRFSGDEAIVNRAEPTMPRDLEMALAHKRLLQWDCYFKETGVSCFALSRHSETPFQKVDIESIC